MYEFDYKVPSPRQPIKEIQENRKVVNIYEARDINFTGVNNNREKVDFSKLNIHDFFNESHPHLKLEHNETVGTIRRMEFQPVEKDGGIFNFEFSFTDKEQERRWVNNEIDGFSFGVAFKRPPQRTNNGRYFSGESLLKEITLTERPAYGNKSRVKKDRD